MTTKKTNVDPWRTAAFFIEEEGVFEVLFDAVTNRNVLRCVCDSYLSKGGCRHTAWVQEHRMRQIRDYKSRTDRDIPSPEDWRKRFLVEQKIQVM